MVETIVVWGQISIRLVSPEKWERKKGKIFIKKKTIFLV